MSNLDYTRYLLKHWTEEKAKCERYIEELEHVVELQEKLDDATVKINNYQLLEYQRLVEMQIKHDDAIDILPLDLPNMGSWKYPPTPKKDTEKNSENESTQ